MSFVKTDIINENTDDEARKILEKIGQQEEEQSVFALLKQIDVNTGFQPNFGKVKLARKKSSSRNAVFRFEGAKKIVGIGIVWGNKTISGKVSGATVNIDGTVHSVISGETTTSFPAYFMQDCFSPLREIGLLTTPSSETKVYDLLGESSIYFDKARFATFECKEYIEINLKFTDDSNLYHTQANVLYEEG